MYFDARPAFLNRGEASMTSSPELLGYRAAQYEQYRPLLQGKTVLDVGCCDGRWSSWALDSGAINVHGIDIEPSFIGGGLPLMQEYFPEGGYSFDAVSWQDADPVMAYDVVLLFGVLYWQDPYGLLKKAMGWGSTLLIDTPVNITIDGADITLPSIATTLEDDGFIVTAMSYPDNPDRFTVLAVRA